MSDSTAHLVMIPLRDGSEMRVASDGIHIDDAFYALASIQDARQVAPEPETIALRVAGAGMIEFQPARPGDGALALEALFRLRPELRPAGFAPVLPADMPPLPAPYAPYAPYTPTPPPAARKPWMLDQRIPVPPDIASAYGPQPNRGRADLTPYPRRFGQLIGAIVRLYGRHLGAWLILACIVAFLPNLVMNGLQVALDAQRGIDPLAGHDVLSDLLNPSAGTSPTSGAAEPSLYTLLTTLLGMLSLVLGAWTLAALTLGARDAVLGRRVSLKTSLASGFQRVWKTLATTLLVILLLLGAALLALFLSIVIAMLLSIAALPFAGKAAMSSTQPSPLGIALVASAFVIAFLPVLALGVRLALAPSLAALGYDDPVRRSLLLTRRQWWRAFGVLLLVSLPALVGALAVLAAQYVAVGLALVVVSPLVQLLVAPWLAVAHTALIYDLRLRREGYGVFMQERITPVPPTTV